MPAEAGIQVTGDNNNFEALDSRFRGNDGVFIHCNPVLQEREGEKFYSIIKPLGGKKIKPKISWATGPIPGPSP